VHDVTHILGRALPRAGRTILLLCKLMLPISLGVALLRWTGALERIAALFAPAMALFHLPGEAAVALLTAQLAGIYALLGALAVLPLGPESITILGAMTLVAHNLIVESAVQDRAGTPWWWVVIVRLVTSVLIGLLVAWAIRGLQSLHIPALWLRIAPQPSPAAMPEAGSFARFLLQWGEEALRLLVKVALVVTAMMIATEWIRAVGLLTRLERATRPLVRLLGISERLAFPWLTAQILGVTFGSGLLIEELREREADPAEVRALHTSIGISHSFWEDTILLTVVGASIFWILVPRLVASALVVRLIAPLPFGLRRTRGELRK
jgi:hypothetical protein